MGLGLGALRLSPSAFWAMTPKELEASLAGAFGEAVEPMTRRDLGALMARYPDTEGRHG
jgi:uncharacterized phage protein (TIGR02216 family)